MHSVLYGAIAPHNRYLRIRHRRTGGGGGLGFGRDLALCVVDDELGRRLELDLDDSGDLATVEGDDCALQSVLFRVWNRRGELGPLGHPEFGSLLEGLVGEPLDARTLRAAEALVREAIASEPRVREVVSVVARPLPGGAGGIELEVDVRLDDDRRLRVGWPQPLGG